MPSAGIPIQCAHIFWTPVYNLVEYQCAFCTESFVDHFDCIDHIKKCPKNTTKFFEFVHDPSNFESPIKPENNNEKPLLDLFEIEFKGPDNLPEQNIEFVPVFLYEEGDKRKAQRNGQKPTETLVSLPPKRTETRLTIQKKNKLEKIRNRNEDQQMVCDMCGKIKKNRRSMVSHMNIWHRSQETGNDDDYNYKCEICSKKFAKKHILKYHLERHTAKFNCEYCGKIFRDASNLKVHIRIHTGERPYHCKLCGNTFGTSNSLLLHTSMHRGDRRFKCTECPLAFITSNQRQKHMNVHTRAISYKCDQCDKVFRHSKSMKLHRRSHTGERPYECKLCGRTFARQQTFAMHMNTHTGNKPYSCKLCDRSFHSSAARCLHEKNFHKTLIAGESCL